MKKYFLTLTALLTTVAAYGQGTIVFANSTASAVTNALTMARVAVAEFRVSLYFLPDTGVAPPNEAFDLAGIVVATTNFFAPGFFNGQERRINEIMPAGGNGWFQVRAWELAFGTSYAEAASNPNSIGGRRALVGQSNIMKIDTGDPTTVPAGPATPLVVAGLKSFFVTQVPEPSTFALGALGLSALLFLRRRK